MNARVRRIVVLFLAGFILLSLVPAMPDLWHQLSRLDLTALAAQATAWSDLLLGTAAGLLTLALAIRVVRRVRAARADAFEAALAQHTDRQAERAPSTQVAHRPMPPVKPFRRSPRRPQPAASELETKIRAAAKKGEKIPALARRLSLSVDAIRAALGDSLPEASAPRGNSFRGRQQRLPAKPPAALPPRSRKPYGALA